MLFKRLVKLLKLLKKQSKHIKLFLLNGSFVNNKDSPKDEPGYKRILEFFCYDREGNPKGILEVLL